MLKLNGSIGRDWIQKALYFGFKFDEGQMVSVRFFNLVVRGFNTIVE